MNVNKAYNFITNSFRKMPDFLIIGTQKGGTTSLFNYLVEHPNILPPLGNKNPQGFFGSNKELHYFDRYFERGVRWYRSHFPFPQYLHYKKRYITGEATPDYLSHPHAPKRVKELIPHVKLIVLLRNPVDRAYSHYIHNVTGNVKEDLPFENALFDNEEMVQAELKRMLKRQEYQSSFYDNYSYLYRGIYIEQIKHWFSFFPKEQFFIVKSEDLFANPQEIYQKVLEFLKLPNWLLKSYKAYNPQKMVAPEIYGGLKEKLVNYYYPYNQKLSKYLDCNFEW